MIEPIFGGFVRCSSLSPEPILKIVPSFGSPALSLSSLLPSALQVSDLVADFDYKPNTKVNDGVAKFVEWYSEFYGIKI